MIKLSIITSLYRGEDYLENFLSIYRKKITDNQYELVLIHNDPTQNELLTIKQFQSEIENFTHLKVPREKLYESWNRGIAIAKGEYIATWNVDDIRTLEGIKDQIRLLDNNSDIQIVTGDYIKVFNYGEKKGVLKRDTLNKSIFYNAPRFRNGCFLMWRKSIHEKVGYFDEQLQIVGDREFWYRVTKNYKAGKVDSILGYYLRDSSLGLSKTRNGLKENEGTLVKMRYCMFYLSNIWSAKFNGLPNVNKILNFGEFKKLTNPVGYLSLRNLPSYFLFFVPFLKRIAVEVRFYFYEKIKT